MYPAAIRVKLSKPRPQLVISSFLMLFLELALIRWSGSNIVYLSYFTNFILLGSFLGISIGFLRSHSKINLFPYSPVALVLFIGYVRAFPVQINHSGSQLIYFGNNTATGLPAWITLPVIFLMVALVMATVAEGVARRFQKFKPLEAYRLDILGSISGIVLFSAISFANSPPFVWAVVVCLCFAVLIPQKKEPAIWFSIAGILIILGIESLFSSTFWSPYYKISLSPGSSKNGSTTLVSVNGIPHQTIQSVKQRLASEPSYFVPYTHLPNKTLGNVLIIGAGNGGDVAIALSKGASHVDAVEIDPQLYKIGKRLNPDHPYQDPRVNVIINDGRAFLESTNKHYDLILFALPDSLTLVSSQSSLRLESYLFTLQSMQAAKDRLKPGGVFAMYNYYREQWLVDRLSNTLQTAYKTTPCVETVGNELGSGLAVLTESNSGSIVGCNKPWVPSTSVQKPVNDDKPFLYLRGKSIPKIYLVTLLLIAVTAVVAVRLSVGKLKPMTRYLDLFFMGAAFFLLETKSVVQFALLFGTTWFVNALVFGGVLLAVYAAIEMARRKQRINSAVLWATLFASLVVNLCISSHYLLSLPGGMRFVVATTVTFTPIFIANLIFAERFKSVSASTVAFGANLLGAIVGGLLEYSSIIYGYRAMTVLVGILYLAALYYYVRLSPKNSR